MRKTPYFPLGGGLDLVTPITQMPEGRLIGGVNYEPWINGGYRRIFGYERFDGRPLASDAEWLVIDLDIETELEVGDTVTGDDSAATGVIVAIDGQRIVLTKITGDFDLEEPVNTDLAIITLIERNSGSTLEQQAAFRLAAEKEYRDDILQVPGVGPVRGVFQIRERIYAFRDNAESTACIPYKATATGWDATAITLSVTVRFDAGTVAIAAGDVLTGASSSATGTVHRVVLLRGSYGGGDASGYLALTDVTGAYTDGESLQVSAATRAVADGASLVSSLPPGGRYDFVATNLLAGADTYRLYGANGVGPAFEIDEDDVLTPILLDLSFGDAPSENNPFLVEEFDGALWLMFPGGSLQRSATGLPLTFNGFLGAAEFGLGEEGTGILSTAGKVLIAYTRRQIHGFFPSGPATYEKRLVSDRAGCVLYSAARLSTLYAVDDSGIIDLNRAERFGDFADATISDLVQPFIVANVNNVAGVMAIRESNQYRIYFTSGDALAGRMKPDGTAEFGVLEMTRTAFCAYSCEDENTAPSYWWAGGSGFVYKAESGRNFDGDEIESTARLPFAHQGNPASRKRYRLAELEIEAERDVSLSCSYDLSFAGTETTTFNWRDRVVGGGGFYDRDNWDQIYWDAQTYTTARFELRGTGKNLSMLFYNASAVSEPFILQGITLHYDPRRVGR